MTAYAFLRPSLILAVALGAVGCQRSAAPIDAGARARTFIAPAAIPNGELAGAAQSEIATWVHNPLDDQPAAVARGKRLFVQMNCAGCHGYTLGGAMGPNLTDRYWRYGGTPGAVYQSISEGRPQGMPTWRKALPPAEIWRLVSYIQSYGGTTPPQAYQAGKQGDIAALPPTPAAEPSDAAGAPATGRLAHP